MVFFLLAVVVPRTAGGMGDVCESLVLVLLSEFSVLASAVLIKMVPQM